ncbi:MAG: hypothetical protein JWM16_2098 [Verrucomicrobiales bacterium]|nr:hypothetical protein [Verrucomicrobiales bacterium]
MKTKELIMRKKGFLFLQVLLFFNIWNCCAQGTINFNTALNASSVIRYTRGTPFGGPTGNPVDGTLHPTARAALYAGPAGSTEAQLVLVGNAVPFSSGTLAGFVIGGSVSVSFLPQGYKNAVVQIRAWDAVTFVASSYEQALSSRCVYPGKSPLYNISSPLGGPGSIDGSVPPATPANINGQVGFTIAGLGSYADCPEPSSTLLGGIVVILAFRQSRSQRSRDK